MSKGKIDKAQLKATVDAIKKRKRPELHQLRRVQSAKVAKLRRDLSKTLKPLFTAAGFDAAKIGKVLARHQAEMRAVVKKEKMDVAGQLAASAKIREHGLDNARRAAEQMASTPYLTTPIPIVTPYLIYATPVGMLHDSHIEPWNNWAKFTYSSNKDTAYGAVIVNFYFAWQNPSNYLAVINCDADLLVSGIIEAGAEQGWLLPGSSFLELWGRLTVFLGQTAISWQGSQVRQIATVSAEGGWAPIGGSGDLNATSIFGAYHLACSDIQVQGNQIVVFEVACSADWWIDEGGDITLDFDFDPGAYKVACPALHIDLLTPPQGLGAGHLAGAATS
jgi:hypothetical protein